MNIAKAVNRLGIATLLLTISAILAVVAIFQPLYTVIEEDLDKGETDFQKFLGTRLRKETYSGGGLVEVELPPYDSPLMKEVNMRPVLQGGYAALVVSAVLLLLSAGLFLFQRWRPSLGLFGLLLLSLAIAMGLVGSLYLALSIVGPASVDIDEAVGFFPGSVTTQDGSLSWGAGAAWYLSAASIVLAITSLVLHAKELGLFRRLRGQA